MRALSAIASLLWLSPSIACAGSRSGPYSLELVDESGDRLPTYTHGGRTYVLGHEGDRYSLRIRNHTPQRVEFVASVDGRDVLDGTAANWSKRGYVVNAHDQVVIDGFRLNHEAVAAFRFGSVADSYAAKSGDSRDVGVIGVAVFSERERFSSPEPALAAGDQFREDPSSSVRGIGGLGTGFSNAPVDARLRHEAAASRKGAGLLAPPEERPGLGTEFGESRRSHVNDIDFDRAGYSPIAKLTVRYNDRDGLQALGIDLDPNRYAREVDRRERAQPFRESFCAPPPGWTP